MEKSEFIEKLERIVDKVKAEDEGFNYGGEVIYYKEDDGKYDISVNNIEMDIEVLAKVLFSIDDRAFTYLMSQVYRQKMEKIIEEYEEV